jgi:hypothetical protein
MDDLKAEAELHFDGVVMDFELFYEEIEGLDLYMLSRRFDNFGNFSNQQETRQDSVSHQFKKFFKVFWPKRAKQNWNLKSHLNARVED